MMEYTLEEELPDEFKGGTLELDKNLSNEGVKTTSGKNTTNLSTPTDKINNNWKNNFISPFAQLTGSLWQKKDGTTENSSIVVQPSVTNLIRENATNYFTFREEIVERAVTECIEQFLDVENDGPLLNCFLLTEINLWDTEKERLILLTTKMLVNVKYDFIALKRLEYRKIPLANVDTIIIGDLMYPNGSIIPQLNGIVDGFSSVVHSCLLQNSSSGNHNIVDKFSSRNRNMKGIRIMWNGGHPLNFSMKWNPFSNNVPMCTFMSHPLYYHKECTNENQRKLYDMEEFKHRLCEVITSSEKGYSVICDVQYKNITLDNYIGLGSLVHNRNALGFFKVRGKFSF